jgi:hypothetical protein
VAADRRIGEYRDHFRLNLENSAGDEDQLLFAAASGHDAHRARLDTGNQRHVTRVDTELACLARQDDELRLARENRFLCADDVDVDRWGGHYCSVFAFSMASSIAPTM